jgi:hypothetical protein
MDFVNSFFFLSPGDHGFRRCRRISGPMNEEKRVSDPYQGPRGHSDGISPAPRNLNRISDIEATSSSRIRQDSGAREAEAFPRRTTPPPHPRSTCPIGSSERLDFIRRKIASGYYSTAAHLRELADVLMEKIDFFDPDGDDNHPDTDED